MHKLLKANIEKTKDLHRKSSKDYLELMHLSLKTNDKEWFEEWVKGKRKNSKNRGKDKV